VAFLWSNKESWKKKDSKLEVSEGLKLKIHRSFNGYKKKPQKYFDGKFFDELYDNDCKEIVLTDEGKVHMYEWINLDEMEL
jgi:hypothetical protein